MPILEFALSGGSLLPAPESSVLAFHSVPVDTWN